MKPLQTWFARQPLTVKLLVAVPVLALAVLWSAVPADAPAVPTGAASNRPVLSAADPSASPAAQPTLTPHEEPRAPQTGLSWAAALRTVVSVGVVLALIVVSARGLKHVMANAGQLPGTGGGLKVLETSYLPSPNGRGRAAIHLVEMADGRQLLIGATDTTLSLLAELEDTRPRHAVRVAEALQSEPVPFSDVLSAASEKPPRPTRLDSELSERLRRLRASAHRLEAAN